MRRLQWFGGLAALVVFAACSDSAGSSELVTAERPADDRAIPVEEQGLAETAANAAPAEDAGGEFYAKEPGLTQLGGPRAYGPGIGRQDVAPEAEFTATPTTGAGPLPVTFIDQSSGTITSWSWSFGDGELSQDREPTHAYLTPGMYTVGLTARGPAGVSQRVKRDFISVAEPAPTADFTATPVRGIAPLDVTFVDLSDGLVTSWSWDFGDGETSADANPSHTYTLAGSYTVELTVMGPGGSDTTTREAFVNALEPAPVAAFSGTPATGPAPLLVAFTDQSAGAVSAWTWDFGDGGTSNEEDPGYTYNTPGTYTVSLTVTGPGGTDAAIQTKYVVVVDPAPVADFAGLPTSGIRPLNVDFSDLSTGPVTSWSWDFGDGETSNQANPTHSYPTTGTYTVALTVTGPGGSDTATKTGYISALEPPPVASFTGSPNAGAVPLEVTFNDLSTGSVTAWSWDFGDGGASTDPNPIYTYETAGTYTVALTVAGPGGSDVASEIGFVTVSAPPIADFTAAPTTGPAPLLVLFTDLTTGDATTWSWDFGDGGMSNVADPMHTYADPGTYTVTLTVSGPGGSDVATLVDFVTASDPPVAEFIGAPTSGPVPLEVSFNDLSTGEVTTWSWDFGDGGTSNEESPTHTYSTPEIYSVSLTTSGPGGFDTNLKTDFVTATEPAPVASFSATPTGGGAPLEVAFTDLSTGPVTTWSWDFGDTMTSTEANPVHSYASVGTYSVSLTVTGPGGEDTVTQASLITVSEPPVASFSASPTAGELPLDVAFTDTSTGDVTAWSWDFGDGGTSTSQSPMHTYTDPGTYTVVLTSTGPAGSDAAIQVDAIVVTAGPPVADFTGAPLVGESPLLVAFTNATTGDVTSWSWDFGDTNGSTERDPMHTYTAPGTYTVTLAVTGRGGSDSLIRTDYVTVSEPAPVADFSGSPTGGGVPLEVVFTDLSTGTITAWSWDFGDGGSSTTPSPTHTYTTAGTFTVSLTATGPGGADTNAKVGFVTVSDPPVAGFSGMPTTGEVPFSVAFSDLSAGDVTSWSWAFGDGGTSTAQNPQHGYSSSGAYTVELTVTGPGGTDSTSQVGYITAEDPPPPVADFGAAPTSGPAPLDVSFTDLSTGQVTAWTWDLGAARTSSEESPSHVYESAGSFDVSLTVTGPGGSDFLLRSGYVMVEEPAPVADFNASVTTGGVPLEVTFTDRSSGTVTAWSWDFGDASTSNEANPTHTYTTAGTYTVTLTATGPGGNNVETKVDFITASDPPTSGFSAAPTTGVVPFDVTFSDLSTGEVTEWSWDFGDGGSSTDASPVHTYTTAGVYSPTLMVTGPGGMDAATVSDLITASDPAPVAAFSGSPTSGEAPLTVSFVDASTGPVTAWSWDFGDGGSSTVAAPSYEYTTPGTYTVSLEVVGPGGSDQAIEADYVTVDPAAEPCPEPPTDTFTIFADIDYGAAPAAGERRLDVYLPDNPRPCSPTVLFMHAGGWLFGLKDSSTSTEMCSRLAMDGWTVVSMGYTLATFRPCTHGMGNGAYPDSIQDVKNVIDWIRTMGVATFGLSETVVAFGSSTGGYLAMMAGATQGPGEDYFDPVPGADYSVDRVIAFSPSMNWVNTGCNGNPWPPECATNCPAPPGPPFDCAIPPACLLTGGYTATFPCRTNSGNCRDFTAPELLLGEEWPLGGIPTGVDCSDPFALPAGLTAMPTLNDWYDASPYFWLSGDEPPIHFFYTECDTLVPRTEFEETLAVLNGNGTELEVTFEATASTCDSGCQHGILKTYGATPGANRVATILEAAYGG